MQCITCNHCSMQDRGNCVCLLDEELRKVRNSLTVHECKKHKLAPKDSVHSRSSRKMKFNDKGLVILT